MFRNKILDDINNKLKNFEITDGIKEYVADYMYYVTYLDLLPDGVTYNDLLNRLVENLKVIVFFDEFKLKRKIQINKYIRSGDVVNERVNKRII